MRKVLLSVSATIAAMSMNAQTPYAIPNAGFETWTNTWKAANWSGYNDIGLIYGIPNGMIPTYFQDASVKHSGSYSMRIENKDYTGVIGQKLNGIAWLGTAGTTTANAGVYGIPFTQNIQAFSAWLSYTISASATGGVDTAVVFCQTTKWTGGTEQLMEDASILTTTNVPTFQNFTQPVVVVNAGVPDTLWIVALSSFNAQDTTYSNTSKLWIDDLSLTVVTGVTAPVLNFVDTRFAPNPASDVVRFTTSALNIGGTLQLFDITGKVVLTVPVTSALDNRFNVEALPAGVYFYQVSNAAGEINANGKLVVTH